MTATEWKYEGGGFKDSGTEGLPFRRLPFNSCAISFLPFEDPAGPSPSLIHTASPLHLRVSRSVTHTTGGGGGSAVPAGLGKLDGVVPTTNVVWGISHECGREKEAGEWGAGSHTASPSSHLHLTAIRRVPETTGGGCPCWWRKNRRDVLTPNSLIWGSHTCLGARTRQGPGH